jgi:hypothetical protein
MTQNSVGQGEENASGNSNMSPMPFSPWINVIAGALVGLVLRLIFSGEPNHAFAAMGSGFMIFAPFAVGTVTVYMAERKERRSWIYYFLAAAFANILFVTGTFLALIEGLICVIIAAPLFGLIGGISGLVMGFVCRKTNWPKQSIYSFILLPVFFGAMPQNSNEHEQLRSIDRSIVIAATPTKIWNQLHQTVDIQAEEVNDAWMYRIGVPLPLAGVTEERNDRLIRRVTMGKSIYFDQIASDWKQGEYVRWKYQFYEDSFPPNALDDHVKIGGEYFDLIETTYELIPLDAYSTQLKISMKYRVSTEFNWYALPVARLLIGNFEDVILEFYKRRSLADSRDHQLSSF